MNKPQSQTDIMNSQVASQPKSVTDVLRPPGIDKLHLKSKEEISEVLTNLLRSRPGITAFKYVVGSHVEITYDANPLGQARG